MTTMPTANYTYAPAGQGSFHVKAGVPFKGNEAHDARIREIRAHIDATEASMERSMDEAIFSFLTALPDMPRIDTTWGQCQ